MRGISTKSVRARTTAQLKKSSELLQGGLAATWASSPTESQPSMLWVSEADHHWSIGRSTVSTLRWSPTVLALVVLSTGCTTEQVVYRDREPFNQPKDS